ncbi:MAG TPA: FadR/GntR family transcriptional regulator [Spirochaetota bacterium]|nr:FadR/GntR family transcriptional regulator [Spirochaetota bacterium]HPI90442.1 FadR/GntR family transcriptional regulator [Spirochaetota bacterium]HPR49351.1 FadR/GntR family transcriptional regulator [Spirochaetota bacterium]
MDNRLHESIFLELQKGILKGKYPPGSRFPSERDLARRYNVSRSTIREAMGKLAKSGLVETRPQSGTYVSEYQTKASLDLLIEIMQRGGEVDSDILLSLMETRSVIELHAARVALENFSPDDIDYLKKIVTDEKANAENPELIAECDYALHQFIMQKSGNFVIQLIFNSFKPVYRFYTGYFFSMPGSIKKTIQQHEAFVRFAELKNMPAAVEKLAEALDYGKNRVVETLGIRHERKMIRLVAGI